MKERISSAARRFVVVIGDKWDTTGHNARKALLAAILAIPISIVVAIVLGVVFISIIMALSVVIVVLGLVGVVLAIVLAIVPPLVLVGLLLAPLYYGVRVLQRRRNR